MEVVVDSGKGMAVEGNVVDNMGYSEEAGRLAAGFAEWDKWLCLCPEEYGSSEGSRMGLCAVGVVSMMMKLGLL